mmetsp:Transcript_8105/g.29916  ORF Transcript_8105/g.29916 Transcript_8105/m.29916 type:complete len:122 (-) Transcript_8105:2030-2395(-)
MFAEVIVTYAQAKGLFSVPFVTLEIYGEELAEEEVSGRPIVCVLNTMESRGWKLVSTTSSSFANEVTTKYLMHKDKVGYLSETPLCTFTFSAVSDEEPNGHASAPAPAAPAAKPPAGEEAA